MPLIEHDIHLSLNDSLLFMGPLFRGNMRLMESTLRNILLRVEVERDKWIKVTEQLDV